MSIVIRKPAGRDFAGLVLTSALLAAGCAYPELEPQVSGEIKVDGKPATGTWVFFIPTDRERHADGMIGQAYTDDQGKFQLKNQLGKDTFYTGRFKVTFTRYVKKNGKPIAKNDKPDDVGAVQQLLPEFLQPGTTPFTVDVAEQNRTFTFELRTK